MARRSSTLPLDISFVTRSRGLVPPDAVPTTPTWQRHQAVPPGRFRLFPFRSPLLGESQLLSFPRVTEMFQFTRFPPLALCVQTRVTPHDGCRVSPFGYPRIEAWSAAPRGFSQPPTSFFGFRRQGIHRWLFIAWRTKDARARSEILKDHWRRQEVAVEDDGDSWRHGKRVEGAPRKRNSEPANAINLGVPNLRGSVSHSLERR